MPVIALETDIRAPVARVFDLVRDMRVHAASAARTGERVVAGKVDGLLEAGDEVTFEGVHFGVRQRLTARVTVCEPPALLVDELVRGAFARFTHTHRFAERDGVTTMADAFDYTAPLGPLGRIADALFLERHMRAFLRERAAFIRELAERG